jgi:glycosyltransferase involved in cell wall biosynthesis
MLGHARPKLSVGLAVFNGERYLIQALDSILGQTLKDFELIISDNASTDRTEEICRAYAERDPRIQYHRNERNIGGANNENLTCILAKGEYFRWAAHDDVCAPELFEKCVAVLDRNPEVVISYPQVVEINGEGKTIGVIGGGGGEEPSAHARFRRLMRLDHHCVETYGVMRRDVLLRTHLEQNYTDSDRTLLCELALYGRFYQVPEPLFFRRIHVGKSTVAYSDWRKRMVWFDDSFEGRITLPHWLQFLDYLKTIGRVPLAWNERLRCLGSMIPWLIVDGHGRWMMKDLYLAARAVLAHASQGGHTRCKDGTA